MPGLDRADARPRVPRGPHRRGRDHPALSPFARSPALRLRRRSSSTRATRPLAERRAAALSLDTDAARRAARAGRAARAARRRRPSPRSRPTCSGSPRTAGPATPRRPPTCCASSARCRPTRRASGVSRPRGWSSSRARDGRSAYASPATSAGRPSRTPAGSATRSAPRCPVGIPEAFLEPVADPVGDLVARYARTHGPFTDQPRSPTGSVSARPSCSAPSTGCRPPVASSRASSGPAGAGTEWCDAEVLRLLRRRSLAALRQEAEPVPTVALARFLPAWQDVGSPLRGVDGVLRVVEQLQGAPLPASALERLVLPARVRDYSPALLDELTTAGEVLWCGHGSLPGDDGWVSLHLAENAPLTLPLVDARRDDDPAARGRPRRARRRQRAVLPRPVRPGRLARRRRAARRGCGTSPGPGASPTTASARCAPSSAGGRGAHSARRQAPRSRYGRPGRAGRPRCRSGPDRRPPRDAGRCCPSARPRRHPARRTRSPRRCSTGTASSPAARSLPNARPAGSPPSIACSPRSRRSAGRAAATPSKALAPPSSSCPGAVDRLRTYSPGPDQRREPVTALVLAATDPANPTAPRFPGPNVRVRVSGHRPGRKAGALVVLHDGSLVLYVERGGRSLLTWTDEPDIAAACGRRACARGARGPARQAGRRAGRRHRCAQRRLPARLGARAGRLPRDAARPAAAGMTRRGPDSATPDDARGIARVRSAGWRAAYPGLVVAPRSSRSSTRTPTPRGSRPGSAPSRTSARSSPADGGDGRGLLHLRPGSRRATTGPGRDLRDLRRSQRAGARPGSAPRCSTSAADRPHRSRRRRRSGSGRCTGNARARRVLRPAQG